MKKIALTVLMFSSLFAGTALASQYDRSGFVTKIEDGRLWVFREDSQELKDFKATGEPAKIGSGPKGMTVKAADEQILLQARISPIALTAHELRPYC